MTPYKGNENYIFISYAHKDSARVLPILETLAAEGFRIWFDEGIEVGSEWPAFVAARVRGCARMIYFVTEASVDSKNCRNEVNLAYTKDKEILVAYLDRVELKHGMDLQLGTSQAVFRDKYSGDDAFVRSLARAELLQVCRETPSSAPAYADLVEMAAASTASGHMTLEQLKGYIESIQEVQKLFDEAEEEDRETLAHCEMKGDVLVKFRFFGKEEIRIPASVRVIGKEAFRGCRQLRRLDLTTGVEEIGDWAFANCTGLAEVDFAQGLKKLGASAFYGCHGITRLALPQGLETVGKCAFTDCTGVTELTLPQDLHSIGAAAFMRCSRLTRLSLPRGLREVAKDAFYGCEGIEDILIADIGTKLDPRAFFGCKNLMRISVPRSWGKQPLFGLPAYALVHRED
ncbi:MAG: leucine-rich repeat protein [Clostridia bacterium]|nr:leucine-rich repeat protein [Clostridia bacterium]